MAGTGELGGPMSSEELASINDPPSHESSHILELQAGIANYQREVDKIRNHVKPYFTHLKRDEIVPIAKAPYNRSQHEKIKCKHCNDKPDGYRGRHELRRHTHRAHGVLRKAFVCTDISPNKQFLAHCKQCKLNKRYNAYYNAAAHLRRVHFNPKQKDGRKNKVKPEESRGGKGGGDYPSMDICKMWIKEIEEFVSPDMPPYDDNDQDEDAALDAAIEASYSDGFEPADSETSYSDGFEPADSEGENNATRPQKQQQHEQSLKPDLVSSERKNVKMTKETVGEAESEAAVALTKNQEKRQLQDLSRSRDNIELNYEGDEADEEKSMLEELSRDSIMGDGEYDVQTKSALPLQSDSSGLSGQDEDQINKNFEKEFSQDCEKDTSSDLFMSETNTDTSGSQTPKLPVPPIAHWTELDRKLVDPEALDMGNECHEITQKPLNVLRILTKEAIQQYEFFIQMLREGKSLFNTKQGEVGHQNSGDIIEKTEQISLLADGLAYFTIVTISFLHLTLTLSLLGAWTLPVTGVEVLGLVGVWSLPASFRGQLKCRFSQAWFQLQFKYHAFSVSLVGNLKRDFSRFSEGHQASVRKTIVLGRCRCGHRFYDGFIELRPEAAARYEKLLREKLLRSRFLTRTRCTNSTNQATGTQVHSDAGSTSPQNSGIASVLFGWVGRLGAVGNQTFRQKDNRPPLPQYELEEIGAGITVSPPRNTESLYLLLCIPRHQYATRLLQPQLSAVKSDKAFFLLLRKNYRDMRGRAKAFLSLKVLRGIKFVQLEMYKSELVDIRKQDDLPPEDKKDEYRYRPIPPEIVPPVGENHMLHLFNHPSHAEDDGLLLDRIPKKLRERLLVCPSRGTGLGWGIYFIEGWHTSVITLVAFAVLLAGSLAFLICWSVLKHDVQGASGVAAYMVAFLGLAIGSVQAGFELT